MAGPAQLLQAEDANGTRRNVGGVTSAGQGAVRTVAPDSDSLLALVRDRLDILISLQGGTPPADPGEPAVGGATEATLLQVRDALANDPTEATLLQVRDALAALATEATLAVARDVLKARFGAMGGAPVTVTNAGSTTLYTPAAGRRVRVKWLGAATPEGNPSDLVLEFRLGATPLYRWPLGRPGVFAHGAVREGAVDAPLVVVLDAAGTVYVNLDVEEF